MSGQLEQAIINAHNAGDFAAAKRMGELLKQEAAAGNNMQVQQGGQYQSPLPSPHANQAPPKDNAFQYGVDQAQNLYGGFAEGVGQKIGSETMVAHGQNVQAQQEKDIAKGDYQFKYDGFKDAVEKDGVSGFASHAGSAVAAGLPTTGATLVGGGLTAAAAAYSAPAWLVASLGAATTATGIGLGIGENVLEQKEKTGKFDSDVAIGVGVVSGLLDRLGVRKVFNLKDLEKMTSQQIADTLRKKGMGEKAAQFLKGMGVEAATETGQEGLNMAATATQGGEYTGEEVQQRLTDAGITGGLMAGTIKTGTGTLGAATNLVRGSNTSSAPADQEATASFAQRLAEIAEANGYDLQDIDKMSSQGARETVDKAHIQYTEDLKQLFADLKSRVAVTDQDSLEEVAQKVLAAAAYREGRNKTKSTVGVQEMSALESLSGDTREGQQALSVLRQLNQLTKLHNGGYQGGVSAITDQFAIAGGGIGYDKGAVATERLLRPLLSGSAALSTGGTSLLGQAAVQGTGRMIDKITGRRSVVDRFVKQNRGQPGIPGSTSPSLREESFAEQQAASQEAEALQAQQEAQAQEEANLNEYVYNQGGLPNDQSPAGTMSSVLGIDPEQMMTMLDEIIATEPNPQIVDAAIAAQGSIVQGGRVPNLNQLISMMKLRVNPDPQFWIERDRSAGQAAAKTKLSRQEQNYQRGIENNQAFNQELQNAVDDDGSIPPLNKAYLKVALADLARDLGAQPLDMVNSIIERAAEKGVTQEQMQSYLAPYLERVQQQQDAKNSRDQAAAEVEADPINESRVVPVPFNNAGMQGAFGVDQPTPGGNFIDLDTKADLTGNTYAGGSVKIIDGKPLLETSETSAAPATKESGNKVKVSLFKKKRGWSWVDYDGPDTIVSTEQGGKHHYSLSSDFQTPVTLQTYPKQPSEPRLRPTSQGKVVLGNKIGSISVRGRLHPVYDQVTIEDKRGVDPINESRGMPLIEQAATAERKQRAEEQGFDTSKVYYHGTYASYVENTAYESFDNPNSMPGINRVGTWLDDSSQNYAFLDGRANDVVYPVYIKNTKGFDVETSSVGEVDPFHQLAQFIAADKDIELRYDGAIPPNAENNQKIDEWSQSLRDMGYTHINLLGTSIDSGLTDGKPRNFTIVLDPKNIRSVNAQFDPAEAGSDRLVANKKPVLQLDTSPSIIPVLNGTETPPKLSGKTEVAKYLESRAQDRIGGVREISIPEDRSAIADDMVAEAIYEMEQQDEGSAMDWYDSTIEKMLGMMALKYPEIETDVNAKTPMLIALSIMSQNMDVPTNLKIAEKAYEYFRDNGKFQIFGQGKSSKVMKLNFKKANILLEKLGSMDALEKLLQTKFSVKDLNPVLQAYLGEIGSVGGENVDTQVYGSAVFGPKVGNGFYTNLRGDFTPVTMDMWFMRTVGRLRGKVMAFDETKLQGQLDKLKSALGRKRISREKLIEEAFKLIAKHEKDYKVNRKLYDLPKGNAKRKQKSKATLAAYTIKGSLRDTVDAPANGTERNDLRKLVQEAVEKFNTRTGLDIEPAAFQALIWYPEQDLYKSLGVPLKNVRKDFASSLKELLIKEGFNEADLNSTIDRVQQSREQRAGSVRQSPAENDARSPGRSPAETGGPVQGQTDPVNPAIKPGTGILSGAVSDYFKQPTPAQIKEQVEPAEKVTKFVLGKAGSEFENGISTYDDLVDLANMLDVSVEIVSASKMQDKGSMGQMQSMLEGTAGEIKIQPVKKLGPLEFMKTLSHEVSHALEGLSLDGLRSESIYKYNAHPQARGSQDVMRQSSLRSRLNEVIELAFAEPGMSFQKKHDSTPSVEVSKKIVAEIDELQKGTMVGFADKPELGQQPMRETFPQFTRAMLEFNVPLPKNASATQIAAREAEIAKMGSNGGVAEQIAKKFVGYHDYIKETAEFGVDPLHFYLMDPKGMKKMMPETFKFMRDIFNKSSMPIEMHANPMMTVIALLLAGFGKALSGEEEEESPQGALAPQPGMLTT